VGANRARRVLPSRGRLCRHATSAAGAAGLRTLWTFLNEYLKEPDLNAAAVKAFNERGREVVGELLAELKITESEYRALVVWSRRLNEIAKPPKVEVAEEEEEGDEEE
jgi:hypothetical protein